MELSELLLRPVSDHGRAGGDRLRRLGRLQARLAFRTVGAPRPSPGLRASSLAALIHLDHDYANARSAATVSSGSGRFVKFALASDD